MQSHSTFIFDSYLWNPEAGTVQLKYSLDDEVHFTETLTFPSPPKLSPDREEDFDRALFALHLIGGISYYKTCLPKEIDVRSGTLTEAEAAFWNGVYENGLGEFFYRNNIDFAGLINFRSNTSPESPNHPAGRRPALETSNQPTNQPINRLLIPIGGGKDSLVTAELVRNKAKDITLLRMGGHPLIDDLASVSGFPLLTIKRALSPELFKLNADGALNGHVPITAYLSCVTIVTSLLYGFDDVVMSNERSANIGNVAFRGKEINHQWSKSLEFEKAFQDYLKNSVTNRVQYFSLLRPLSELRIAEIFTKFPQYFRCSTSCNTNWKILGKKDKGTDKDSKNPAPHEGFSGQSTAGGVWCNHCPKCAFVFALYAAFLPLDELLRIFGKNLFDDISILPLFQELLGIQGFKPFECVGTPEEAKAAFLLAHKKGELNETVIMKMFVNEVLTKIKKPEALIKEVLAPVAEHAIPEEFRDVIR